MASTGEKHVVGVSLGSSRRDHRVETELFGIPFIIERRGTDGDLQAAVRLLQELDGHVDAFGMGGIDLYVMAGRRRYVLRSALPLARAPRQTPIVDGSGLKNTLERRVVHWLVESGTLKLRGQKVLLVSAVDRFGMAEAMTAEGARLIIGDLMFLLGLPIPLRSLRALDLVARVIGPAVCRLPHTWLYPTGASQEQTTPRFGGAFQEADIIAGDFHLIRRYMPPVLQGKTVITNTITADDVVELRSRGVRMLVTTTPELDGRSFATNVMEAVLVAASGRRPDELTVDDYETMLDRLDFKPRVMNLESTPDPD